MGRNVIVSIISLVLYFAVVISIPFKINKYGKNDKTQNENSFLTREILIFVFSFILCLLCMRFEFGITGDVVLCGCGVLGAYIAGRELYDNNDGEEE